MHNYEIPKITLGAGSLYIKDEYLANNLPEITFPGDDIPEYVRSFNLVDPTSAEATFEAEIDAPMFNKLIGLDLSNSQSFSAEFSEPYQEQRRKHKKKRINKKWAKRYGYVTKFRKWRIKEMTFTSKDNFEFEATGRNVELVK